MAGESGFQLSLFAKHTPEGFKATVAISTESQTGGVLDERKAYQQLPILLGHRKFSVICLKFNHPSDDRPKYFVMIGHYFGLVSAVYKYNRRSAALNDMFTGLFELVSLTFYDDRHGFETDLAAPSAKVVAETAFFCWGRLLIKRSSSLQLPQ